MKQVFSRRGQVTVEDVPVPVCGSGTVLIKTAWSLLSPGTERADISSQRIADRVRHRDLVGKVWQQAARTGVAETIRLIRDKIDRPIALGSSLSGIVVETAPDVSEFAPGDRVACGGARHAYHADFVAVPRNLTARLPDTVDLKDAAFVTLGAIALEGLRRSRLELGETAVVVGLGLIGLLTVQILRAAGVVVFAIDPIAERVALAQQLGAAHGHVGGADAAAVRAVIARTQGQGADAVLLTAATSSSEPVNQAFEMGRERGRIVIVGDVGLELSRPTFYRMEQEVLISRSSGPGRYDPSYEEKGIDYPFAYARWTAQRNMEAFLGLLAQRSVEPSRLIAAEYSVERASEAYESVANASGFIAILVRYGGEPRPIPSRSITLSRNDRSKPGATGVAVIGAGAFAQHTLLPLLARQRELKLRRIVGGSSGSGLHQARRFGAEIYGTDPMEALDDPDIGAVVIATRHDLHAHLAVEAIRRGKAVFVEKPLALTLEECRTLAAVVGESGALLTVGFNRRFAPLAREARAAVSRFAGPGMAIYRVNAGALPADHWILDPRQGGGRIIGEGCHFFDLLGWLLGEEPTMVHAMAPSTLSETHQELAVNLGFSGGSVGTIVYSASGHRSVAKERIEIFKGGASIVLDDFGMLTVNGAKHRARGDEKGFEEEISSFVNAVRGRGDLEVTVRDGVRATLVALQAIESASAGRSIPISLEELGL